MGAMRYKPSDRVRIKSLDWYNENINNNSVIICGSESFTHPMSYFCGKVVTIVTIQDNCYRMLEDDGDWYWTDEMIEGLVEEETKSKDKRYHFYTIQDAKDGDVLAEDSCIFIIQKLGDNSTAAKTYCTLYNDGDFDDGSILYFDIDSTKPATEEEKQKLFKAIKDNGYKWNPETKTLEKLIEPKFREYSDNEPLDVSTMTTDFVKEHGLPCPEGYIFKDENGNVINATKIVLEKKKKEYPKTYKECIGKLPINWDGKVEGYKCNLLTTFQKLLICRDAYWQIAGEEMGLNRPWKPDWNDEEQDKYGFHDDVKYTIINSATFVFPTPEMRDAFKENFDPDIEICKEFL